MPWIPPEIFSRKSSGMLSGISPVIPPRIPSLISLDTIRKLSLDSRSYSCIPVRSSSRESQIVSSRDFIRNSFRASFRNSFQDSRDSKNFRILSVISSGISSGIQRFRSRFLPGFLHQFLQDSFRKIYRILLWEFLQYSLWVFFYIFSKL